MEASAEGVKPLFIDLFCGLGGWAEGALAAGYDVVGFDNGATAPYAHGAKYPGQLVLQDVLMLHGSQFRDAAVIVASPPCQNYSYLAMPWSRSKCPLCKGKNFYYAWQLERGLPPSKFSVTSWGPKINCDCKENSAKAKALRKKWETEGPDNRLLDACFRIQREAIEATGVECTDCVGSGVYEERLTACDKRDWPCEECKGSGRIHTRYIPMVVENVRGAQPWVGRAKANFGSFYLWGDVEQVGLRIVAGVPEFGAGMNGASGRKNRGGSWFDVAHNTESGTGRNPVNGDTPQARGRKAPGFRFDSDGSFQTALFEAMGRKANPDGTDHPQGSWFRIADSSQGDRGQKVPAYSDPRRNGGKGVHLTSPAENADGTKIGGDWFRDPACHSKHGSRSNARKQASAMIAKIPFALSLYIAQAFYPRADVWPKVRGG